MANHERRHAFAVDAIQPGPLSVGLHFGAILLRSEPDGSGGLQYAFAGRPGPGCIHNRPRWDVTLAGIRIKTEEVEFGKFRWTVEAISSE